MPSGEPLSPELVLVAPPHEARLARARLEAEHPVDEERAEQVRRAWERLAEHQAEHVEQAWELVAVRAAEQVERRRERIAVREAERAEQGLSHVAEPPMVVEPVVEEVAEPTLRPEPEPEPAPAPEIENEPEPFVSNVDEEAPDWETLLARLRAEPLEAPATAEIVVQPLATTRRGWRRGIIAVAALLAVVLLVAVAWARDWIGGGKTTSPRASAPTAVAPGKTTAPAQSNTQKNKTKTTKKAAPAFVPARVWSWPRVAGAKRYRVRFFQNGHKVLDQRTAKPRLVLPRTFRFQKARYRWTVLPISAAGKALPAIVNSTFVVS